MNQRSAMIIAAALSAFVLVLVGGLATRLTQSTSLPATSAPTGSVATAPASAVPALDPAIEALVREREATYQAALAEANARLEAANAQIAQANGQLAQAQAPVLVQAPAAAGTPVNRDQAIQIAQAYRGGGEVVKAEFEEERGIMAYEVKFADGSTVYVEASSGQVAYATIKEGGNEHAGDD